MFTLRTRYPDLERIDPSLTFRDQVSHPRSKICTTQCRNSDLTRILRRRLHKNSQSLSFPMYCQYKPRCCKRQSSLSVQHAPSRDKRANCTSPLIMKFDCPSLSVLKPSTASAPYLPLSLAVQLVKEKVNYRRQGCLDKPSYLSQEPCSTADLAWSRAN